VKNNEKQGVERFAEELEALGYRPQRDAADGVWFDYEIENGRVTATQLSWASSCRRTSRWSPRTGRTIGPRS
jgi:hypothetical protein